MKLELTDSAVYSSMSVFNRICPEAKDSRKFSRLFEEHYHCKIVADPADPWVTQGWLEFEDEKYYTWFILQNGVEDVSF